MSITSKIEEIKSSIGQHVQLVAISKTHPADAIQEAYDGGQRLFGESRPQELLAKWEQLPKDIEWHMIGHLQTNKVKMIAPFVAMVQSLDSERLAVALDQAARNNSRVIDVLLEVHVAQEQSKTGWDEESLVQFVEAGGFDSLPNLRVRGVMGIATYTDCEAVQRRDFEALASCMRRLAPSFDKSFDTLSMGMSGDYELAIECGATSIRVGSLIFGER